MSKEIPNFEDLEQKVATDTLNKALNDLHGEINEEIERNKEAFSDEIKQTLYGFKKNLEQNVSEEIEKKMSKLLDKHFFDISSKVTSSFYESASPVLKRAEEDMQRLHNQGESTLRAWKEMMKPYANLWNRPFFIMFLVSVLVGSITSVFSSYLLVRDDRNARQGCESDLRRCESDLQYCAKNYFEIKDGTKDKVSKPDLNIKIRNKKK